MKMHTIHTDLADGRWNQFSLLEQLGNVGSEVGRALKAKEVKNTKRENNALDRALELFDFTIADPKNRKRLKEVCRAREVVCDFFFGENVYKSTSESLNRYFLSFAIASRLHST